MRRLAYFVSHPIQYQAPLLKLLSEDADIDLTVFFFSDFSLKAYQDEGFGQSIKWDVSLTEGYNHHFLKCWGSPQRDSCLRQPVANDIHKQLKDGRFDAVWVHGWSWLCSLQAIVAAKQLGIPVLLRGESNGLTEPTNLLKKMSKKVFLQWLFQKVDAFLYIGSLNKQFYQHHGIEEARLFSVPYAVDNDFFQQQSLSANVHRETLRQSLKLDPGRQIILYAAKFVDVKRPQDLLTAYRALSVDGVQEPTPYLLFVGDGVLRSEMEATAKETGWDSIRFLGFRNQSEMPAMYDLCDVFVLPSRFEPWGLAINEVMNAGKAVVKPLAAHQI
jgi:glycosyltransferase involved in cell wall biosynthesis